MIYEVRGKQNNDFAFLYVCVNRTKIINQAVGRNLERFPEDFCFQLTNKEYKILKSQIGTSKNDNRGGRQKLPFAFTEQGVVYLAFLEHLKLQKSV